ncbi:FixH family protein [Cellulophaga sp. HaHa_2_95]|uniref:FixH family protein n=1 Tax=unclassified Cellulophaga TaxID=2634405 RepID=UPI001C4EC1D8|nr:MULTISPECIES: FixH family protein [unclassified Cellulophaga]QXP51475.1 FixH family protein [Cellulophaga sp. HaHa_2_1]QXP56195.1 FixH family protein [Cellulophaga sp. HaHa_2_95]
MKINWGTGVVIAFVCFISFILFFVIRMNMDDKANHDLVTEEYYQEEIGYQKEIDAVKNANHNSKKISLQKTTEGLEISFPENLNNKEIKGTVSLYRPSNKHLDFDFPISLSDSHLLVPDKRLLEGRWDIKISWKYQNEEYLHKEKITY